MTVFEDPGTNTLLSYSKQFKGSRIKWRAALYFFRQIALGVKHLHDQEICLRNLSLKNIKINEVNVLSIVNFTRVCINKNRQTETESFAIGPYDSPELANNKKYWADKTDIWSLGVILFRLLTGKMPYNRKKYLSNL